MKIDMSLLMEKQKGANMTYFFILHLAFNRKVEYIKVYIRSNFQNTSHHLKTEDSPIFVLVRFILVFSSQYLQ